MSKSLEDQFRQLGLADEKQVRKARQGRKKKKGAPKPVTIRMRTSRCRMT